MAQAKKKILVVDDDQDVVAYLQTWLSDEGFEVEVAGDGLEAQEKCQSFHPDLITLDIVMPQKTGVKFYQEIRKNPATAQLPIIIITGLQQEFKQFISHRRTAPPPEGYIAKPFSREELLKTIETVFRRKPAAVAG